MPKNRNDPEAADHVPFFYVLVPKRYLDRLDKMRKADGLTKSGLVRRMIELYLRLGHSRV